MSTRTTAAHLDATAPDSRPARAWGDLHGRVAVVTGAAQGIGLAIVERLRAAGADVVGVDLHHADVDCDVADFAALADTFDRIVEERGALDILVNNAGRGSHTLPHDLTAAEFDAILRTNVGGYFFGAQAACRAMRQAGGSIVNISSIAGSTALGRGNLAYSISKSAIDQLTRELAVEWAGMGIRVNAVAPCQVRTPGLNSLLDDERLDGGHVTPRMLAGIPLGRLAEPYEIAAAVHFLVSAEASFITGTVLPVDGGNLAFNAGGTIGTIR